MNRTLLLLPLLLALGVGQLVGAPYPWVCDFNGDSKVDLLWHYKGNSFCAPLNGVWFMNGVQFNGGAGMLTSGDTNWSLVGTGKFHIGSDSNRDLLWRHNVLPIAAVWRMAGTTYQTSEILSADPGAEWRIAASADLNRDGYTDIVWQSKVTGNITVWFMSGASKSSQQTLVTALPLNTRVMLAGDFGSPSQLTPDDSADLLLYSIDSAGQGVLQIWYLSWNTQTQQVVILGQPTVTTPQADADWQPAMAGDVDGDGKTDLILHHVTMGQTAVWYMNGAQYRNSAAPYGLDAFDTDWRLVGQGDANSTMRLDGVPPDKRALITATTGPGNRINLSWSFPPLGAGQSFQVSRKLTTAAAWGNPIGTGIAATGWTDTTTQFDAHYDYRVRLVVTSNPNNWLYQASTTASIGNHANPNPTLARGRAIVIVDATLASGLATTLDQLRRDLAADGWEVPNLANLADLSAYTVPRHVDYPDPPARPGPTYYRDNNSSRVLATLNLIKAKSSTSGSNVALLIGHVPVPYSGYKRADGHDCCQSPPDHGGAWACDLVYATANTTWPDAGNNSVSPCVGQTALSDYANCFWEENSNHGANDGKFDLDDVPGAPASAPIVDVAVGRVDFARLTPAPFALSETQLIQNYFDKIHRFRYNLAPYAANPFQPKGVMMTFPWGPRPGYTYWDWAGFALRQMTTLYGANSVAVGDPFRQNQSKAFAWGFAQGGGATDRIYDIGGTTTPYTSSLLASSNPEARIAFFILHGSYFGDFDKRQDFLRASIATPNYGFAAMWNRASSWSLGSMAIGEHLGSVLRRTVDTFDRSRETSIMGDPTLRLYRVPPPRNVNLSNGNLTWTTAPGMVYYVSYSDANLPTVPFTLLGTTTSGSYPVSGHKFYRVCAAQLMSTPAAGSYWEISQGVVRP